MWIVIDPNVLNSAAVTTGVSAQLVDRWLSERPFEIVACPTLLTELRQVLQRHHQPPEHPPPHRAGPHSNVTSPTSEPKQA